MPRQNPAADGHEKLYSTLNHELLHVKHPDMSERNIRKMEKKTSSRLSKRRKAQLLSLMNK